MKFFTLITVGAAALASAACTGEQKLSTADYKLSWVGNKYLSGLAKTMSKHKVSLTTVIGDGNHQMVKPGSWPYSKVKQALGWEAKSDFNDQTTKKWVPQGISSTYDAYGKGDWNGKHAWVVSWHNEGDTSVRVTFVDMSSHKYRHVLLVWPTANDDFGPVQCHAGGLFWYGDTLWVVDTKVGLRRFDLRNVWQVESGKGVGKSGSKYTAAGYKYVIPQSGYYKLNSGPGFQFSFAALDRTTKPDSFVVGEYQTAGSKKITRTAKWNLDYDDRTLSGSEATMAYCVGTPRMQGMMSVKGTFYLSQSNVKDPGTLWSWTPGKTPAKKGSKWFPPSPEDLSYNEVDNVFYSVTEAAGKRYIVTYDL